MSDAYSSARPTTVTVAFWLWIASTVIGLIGAIVIVAFAGDSAAIRDLQGGERDAANAALIGLAVIFIIVALLRALFAWYMLKGRNWARIVLTVLGAINIVAVAAQAGSIGVLEWIGVVLIAVAIVLQFLPSSNAYFAQSHPSRQSRA